jgi:anti-sigma regulatory factor (Ser/Thr protein kinase)
MHHQSYDHAEIAVPATAHGPAAARSAVSATLHRWNLDQVRGVGDDAALVATELVTNAVRHTTGVSSFVLGLERIAGCLRITLADPSTTAPVLGCPTASSTGGRGMLLIAALTRAWGTEPRPEGKVVWAELSL